MNEMPKMTAKRGKIRSLEDRQRLAELGVEKATKKLAREQAKAKRAADRQKKAADTLAARMARVETLEHRASNRGRALETRKKIIAGALALKHMEFDGRYKMALMAIIDEYVTRDDERVLFGLPLLPDNDERRVSPPKFY
jgi:hypothetical protein